MYPRPQAFKTVLYATVCATQGTDSFRALWNPDTCSYDVERMERPLLSQGREIVETGIKSDVRARGRLNELQRDANEITRSKAA